ncbi:pyrimidine-nucleoside phosphorylase, partial [Tetragenococcus halophilus]
KRKTMAVISDMSQPLGKAIGNGLEVVEAIETLQGEGPNDLLEMCYVLGSQMLVLGEKAETLEEARSLLEEAVSSGAAFETFKNMIKNQGGDESICSQPEKLLTAPFKIELPAKKAGVVTQLVANEIGIAAMMLGAGRQTKEETIDYGVGLKLHKKVGEQVEKGESLVTIYSNTEQIEPIKEKLYQNIQIGEAADKPILVHEIITE